MQSYSIILSNCTSKKIEARHGIWDIRWFSIPLHMKSEYDEWIQAVVLFFEILCKKKEATLSGSLWYPLGEGEALPDEDLLCFRPVAGINPDDIVAAVFLFQVKGVE